ncbi:MAG: hypothetical protein ACR2G3_04190 [Solirubrobacterales bacterium]
MRTKARFPGIDSDAGHYESFYLKATHPSGGRAVWLRHTVHQRPGDEPNASLWLTLFDANAQGPKAVKATYPISELSAPSGAYIKVADATLEPGRASGAIAAPALDASWELTFADEGEPFFHLPHQRLYRAPLPKTKFLSPYPSAHFDGRLSVGDEEISLEGWPGMIGHNWGAEHADRWVWIQGGELAGQPQSCFDMAVGRIRIGPWTTPWVGNGVLRLDGAEHRLGGFGRVFSLKVEDEPTSCGFEIAGDAIKVRGRVSSEPRNFVAWVYADPKGPEHNTLNCSISDLELEVVRGDAEPERLEVAGAAAYEIGMRQTDHGIPLQPYPDG